MKHFFTFFIVVISFSQFANAQSGIIRGKVFNKINNEPVPFANVVIQGTTTGGSTDTDGNYEIVNIKPGQYNVEVSFVGFKKLVQFEVQVTNSRPAYVDFALEEEATSLDEVVVSGSNTFVQSDESPLSLRTIGTTEIKRTPGGNRDISKVVRSLPGVASTPSFRNDIIIRGGSPSENTFYLDGVQIPVINHFQTQGSSGGPVGIINVDLLQSVDFYSGAFPANRGNTMSSVFDFRLKEGRTDRWTANGIIGATDLGITLEGPISKNSSLVLSARRSYLKFLFNIFNLPFLPVYNDLQFKYKWKLGDKDQITVLGIGAIDDFSLNLDAPQKADTPEDREEAEYILNILPVSTQWNYTTGIRYDHFREKGTTTIVVSTNKLNNDAEKYRNNDDSSSDNLIQRYQSQERETRFRAEDYMVLDQTKINLGLNVEQGKYITEDFSKLVTAQGVTMRDFSSTLTINKWGFFGQISNTFAEKLILSFGLRTDANDYSDEMNDLTKQLSPRFSASYKLTDAVNLNFNTGIYYQLPSYTVLGYRDSQSGRLTNKDNDVTYIRSKHLVSGVEFNLKKNSRITLEGFYKWYDRYPFLLEDSISLANLGADFGVIGNAPVNSTSVGRSYGVEFLFQQKLYNGYYGLFSCTYVRSEFKHRDNRYRPSSWDNRLLMSLTGGKKFGKNWELGVRWLFTGGSPYTPYNLRETVRRENWDVRPYGIPNYDLLNSERISAFHQLDFRIDKKYFFKRWSLNVYFDVQNAYNYVTTFQDDIDVQRDDNKNPIVDPSDESAYLSKMIQSTSGNVLPTIGVIVEL
ncbi:TonB-dependent receptor [Pseudochryseolinea flava]|uniref:TonB-dependent receptor n=1 Tax=Pseudochryseolinea flava TaxID=2059302 RepID=A0A364YBB1_9BACT|nr:TonB-dependent receptor [Pseudochryseolinea flava]RAW03559.1 TonB-dependent receptor [Pseudochryseolinea flava]